MSDQVQVTRAEPRGMITFRGDLSASAIKKAVKTGRNAQRDCTIEHEPERTSHTCRRCVRRAIPVSH